MVVNMKSRIITPIQRRRMVIGKTQTDVAKDARMTKAAVSLIENGKRIPHPRRVRDLAFALQLQPEQLVDLIAAT